MEFSFQLLAAIADCDALQTAANLEKRELDFKKYQLNKRRETSTTTAVTIDTETPAVMAEITAYENVLATLPPGDARKSMESKLTRARYKLFTLQERRENYGVIAMLQLELEISCIEKNLIEIDTFLAQLADRKAELN